MLAAMALATAVVTLLLNLFSMGVVVWRLRKPLGEPRLGSIGAPPISLVRPVRGVDAFAEETLRSSFRQRYPHFEVLLCCADAADPVVPLLRRLITEHPSIPARVLIGRDDITPNPKLNNMVKGFAAARHPYVVFADSNLLLPADYLSRLCAAWGPETGLVSAPPVGSRPEGFAAELECAFLNAYQARWQLWAAESGIGFAQGKTLMWRIADLEAAGGIAMLGLEIAEDAASTKIVQAHGKEVSLAERPFEQPLGRRTLLQTWDRQVRWARLRRVTFPLHFVPEIFSSSLLPLVLGCLGAAALGFSPSGFAAVFLGLWFGLEAVLVRVAGWHLTWRTPFAWMVRDLLIPAVWVSAWLGNSFTWHGTTIAIPQRSADTGLVDSDASLRGR